MEVSEEEKEPHQKVLHAMRDDDGAQIAEAQRESREHQSKQTDEDSAPYSFIEVKAPEEDRRDCDREDHGESRRCSGSAEEGDGLAQQVSAKDVLFAEAGREADTRPQQKFEACCRRDRLNDLVF